MDELRDKIDGLLDDWFRPHQDYIYNRHATNDFLDAIEKLIEPSLQSARKGWLSYIEERKEYFANKDLGSGWSGRESGPCCDVCARRPEHFNGRGDAIKALVGCRNPFQLKKVCQCHIPVREAVKAGIVEAHEQLISKLKEKENPNLKGSSEAEGE